MAPSTFAINEAYAAEAQGDDLADYLSDISSSLGDSRLGSSTNERAKSLNRIVKLIDSIEYKVEQGRDILGDIHIYLIGKFAASAGKKGGEFYTPHEVSMILAKLVTNGVKKPDETFSLYDNKACDHSSAAYRIHA